MGRVRKSLRYVYEGRRFIVRLRHPLKQRTVRFDLGATSDEADHNLVALNKVFLNPDLWHRPPEEPTAIMAQWRGTTAAVKLKGKTVTDDGEELPVKSEEVARLASDVRFLRLENSGLRAEVKRLRKQLEHALGRKIRSGPSPTLKEALATFKEHYQGRDDLCTREILNDLGRFNTHFGETTEIDAMEGREADIDGWLRGLKLAEGARKGRAISAERRLKLRKRILKFLTDSGAVIDRKAIPAPRRDEIRRERGQIRWLEKEQAIAVAEALQQPWQDMFRIQVGIGLRPNELITLKRADFDADCIRLRLSALGNLTLKLGPRDIKLPDEVAKIVKRRLETGDVLFPDPRTGKPWKTAELFNDHYLKALRAAGATAKAPFELDCRTGRRTCGSILIRAGRSVEEVAALLGDDPRTVREHYARILPHEVDSTPAVI
ncbi:MAG: site-specific integrase [Planctomycetota bacterium]|nr:site-specific integrase [Planctomycetota bacterium]